MHHRKGLISHHHRIVVRAPLWRNLLVVALSLLCRYAPADGQVPNILIGIRSGFDIGWQSGSLPVYQDSFDGGTYTAGLATSPGIGLRLTLPELLGSGWGTTVQLEWARVAGRFSTTPADQQWVFDPVTRTLVLLDRRYILSSTMQTVGLDLTASYRINTHVILRGGGSIGYRFGTTFTGTDQLQGNTAGYTFPSGELQRPIAGARMFTAEPLRLGAIASAAYRLPIGSGMEFQPEFTLRADLLSAVRDWKWRTYSLGLGGALLFDLSGQEVPSTPPVVPLREPVRASIEIYAVDPQNRRLPVAKVHTHENIELRHVAFPPAIFFDSGSATIAPANLLTSPDEASRFSPDSLVDLGPGGIYARMLDVVGFRLQRHPGAAILLHGSVSNDEPPSLALARARVVRSYLTAIWGIDSARIGVAPSGAAGGWAGTEPALQRNVEIASRTTDITLPVTTRLVDQSYEPPTIRVSPSMPREGIRRWRITISQGADTLARRSNDPLDSGRGIPPNWSIPHQRGDSVLVPIVAEIIVIDSSGGIAGYRDRLPLLLESDRSSDGSVSETVRWQFIGFQAGSSDLPPGDLPLLRQIADTLGPNSDVTITGFAEATEKGSGSAGLARQRAEGVAARLQLLLKEGNVQGVSVRIDDGDALEEPGRRPIDIMVGRRVELKIAERPGDHPNR
jgi:outer membrane protein OmpA-like peptidoglycan-associated protein